MTTSIDNFSKQCGEAFREKAEASGNTDPQIVMGNAVAYMDHVAQFVVPSSVDEDQISNTLTRFNYSFMADLLERTVDFAADGKTLAHDEAVELSIAAMDSTIRRTFVPPTEE